MKKSLLTLVCFGMLSTAVAQKNKSLPKDTLEKYTQENAKVYSNFKELIQLYPAKYNPGTFYTDFEINEKEVVSFLNKDSTLILDIEPMTPNYREFIDENANGFSQKENDRFSNREKLNIKDISQKRALELAKEYTDWLKEIIFNNGFVPCN